MEQKGKYGAFMGCVRFPDCSRKAKTRKKSRRREPA
ncbi:topoisomerase DNA-binding C4 zinc finger domain-containing protein [Sagittula sp. NFXS13]